MHKAVGSGGEFDKRPEFHQFLDRSFVDLPNLDFPRQLLDHLQGPVHRLVVAAGDGHHPVVADVNFGARLFHDSANHFAAWADHVPDLGLVDLVGQHPRSELGERFPGAHQRLVHLVQNVQPALAGLLQGGFEDFLVDAADLDVHLEGGDPILGAGDLEIHVSQVVLVAQNVGENGGLVLLLDEPHGDARGVLFQRHAGIHQRQRGAAHRGHGRRTVGFQDFRNHPEGIGKFLAGGQQRRDGFFRQKTVADLPASGAAQHGGLPDGKGREIVVEQEPLEGDPQQVVDHLLVVGGAERDCHQGLGFATGEQGRAVGAGQHSHLAFNRADILGGATVHPRTVLEDALPHHLLFELGENLLDLVGRRDLLLLGIGEFFRHLRAQVVQGLVTGLLFRNLERFLERSPAELFHFLDEGGVGFPGGDDPLGFACGFPELLLQVEERLQRLLAEHDGIQGGGLGNLLGRPFHHDDRLAGAHDEQVQIGPFGLLGKGVGDELAVQAHDPHPGDGPLKGDIRNGQRGGRPHHRRDAGLVVVVGAQHRGDHLGFEAVFRGKQRADGAVNKPGDQRLGVGKAPLALEKAAGDLARGVHFFHVMHRKRQEAAIG